MNLPSSLNFSKKEYNKILLNFLKKDYIPWYKLNEHVDSNFFWNTYQNFLEDANCISFIEVIEKNKKVIKKELHLADKDLEDPYIESPITYVKNKIQ